MKSFSLIITVIIFYSCFAKKQELHYEKTASNKHYVYDTIYLDTLFIDNKSFLFYSQNWLINTNTDKVSFLQTLHNDTKDTLEIEARAGAGWVFPIYEETIIPNGCSKISYHMSATNMTGIINTTIDITYRKKGAQYKESKHITVILKGRKE